MIDDVDEYGRPRTFWTVVIDIAIDQERPPWDHIRPALLAHLRDEAPPDGDEVGRTRVTRVATFTLKVPRDPDEDLERVADAMLADLQAAYVEVRRQQAN